MRGWRVPERERRLEEELVALHEREVVKANAGEVVEAHVKEVVREVDVSKGLEVEVEVVGWWWCSLHFRGQGTLPNMFLFSK